jgi:hypothetical protein
MGTRNQWDNIIWSGSVGITFFVRYLCLFMIFLCFDFHPSLKEAKGMATSNHWRDCALDLLPLLSTKCTTCLKIEL